MTLKTAKILYWISTGLIALFTIPGIFFLNSKQAVEGMTALGIPHWLHMEIGIGKFIGAIILIVPKLPKRIKEWAYVAFGIDSLSAAIGLSAIGGISVQSLSPLIFFAILLLSYISYHKIYGND